MPDPVRTTNTSPGGSFHGPASSRAHQLTSGVKVTRTSNKPRAARSLRGQRKGDI